MPTSEPRRTLFQKYATYFAGLVSVALLASGLAGLYFTYHESRVLIEELQREKVDGSGVQQVKVSRIGRDELGPAKDWSDEPGFIAARTGAFHASQVYFRAESEPADRLEHRLAIAMHR